MSRRPLLMIEDMPTLQTVYQTLLQHAGHAVRIASTGTEGLDLFRRESFGVVLLDLMLPDRDGIDLLREILAEKPGTSVIVITADGSINRAVAAMRAGAFDFLVKPFDSSRLLAVIENAQTAATPAPVVDATAIAPPPGFIGTSEPMRRVYATVASVARSMATVFITGESGTGKEICAQAIHAASPRAKGPFVPLNCGAIPSELLESEVFGHLKGSFTGAISDKQGAAAAADGGTLFLDEICELDLALQTKLLRFLQSSTIQPVGAATPRKVNVRIVCATNRDPAEEVRAGHFREDLYWRLHVVPIHMPPLRARGDDVNQIAEVLLGQFAREEGRQFRTLDPRVQQLFRSHPWPGNVRQLLNVLRNVVVLNDGETVTPEMLPADFQQSLRAALPDAVADGLEALLGLPLAEIERRVIEATLEKFGGSVPRAARSLDVAPSTLYRKMEAWGGKK